MAIDTGETATVTFELFDGETPVTDASPTITFFEPDGTVLAARSGEAITHEAGSNVYRAHATIRVPGIHTAVLRAAGQGGRQLSIGAEFVAEDRDLNRIIAGY